MKGPALGVFIVVLGHLVMPLPRAAAANITSIEPEVEEADVRGTHAAPLVGSESNESSDATAGSETLQDPGGPMGEGDVSDDLHALLDEEVVAGASRSAESSTEAPATTWTITGTQLYEYGIHNLAEAFNFLSLGMYSENVDNAALAGLGGRGLSFPEDRGSHILVVLDGHILNMPQLGAVLLHEAGNLPIELIDRVEVILGPGSVLYGTNAMLGVINIVTKDGDAADGLRVMGDFGLMPPQDRAGLPANLTPSRWGREYRVGVRYGKSFRAGKLPGSFVIQADYLDDKGIAFDYGPQFAPGLEVLFDFGENTRGDDPTIWGGNWQSRSQSGSVYTRLRLGGLQIALRSHNASLSSPAYTFGFQDDGTLLFSTNNIDARYSWQINSKIGGMARAYGDYGRVFSTLRHNTPTVCAGSGAAPIAPCQLDADLETWRAGSEMLWNFDWLADQRFLTLVGANVSWDGYTSRTNPLAVATQTKYGTFNIADRRDVPWRFTSSRFSKRQMVESQRRFAFRLRWERPGFLSARCGSTEVVEGWNLKVCLFTSLPCTGSDRGRLRLPKLPNCPRGSRPREGAGRGSDLGATRSGASLYLQCVCDSMAQHDSDCQ